MVEGSSLRIGRYKEIKSDINWNGIEILDLSFIQNADIALGDFFSNHDKFGGLKCLTLACNNLTQLPKGIENLTQLSHLLVPYNRLNNIPDLIRLKMLQCVDISHNNFEKKPSLPFQVVLYDFVNPYLLQWTPEEVKKNIMQSMIHFF
jgi:Leucine-rich repeat (LRR) protein